MEASPSASSKRMRSPGNGGRAPSCLVDGCNSDLSKCRDYHRRHKVCELHSKTPVVTIGGQEKRFCQQCSRFHSLAEFDEGKRSCRKRLDGHNRRRRKPKTEVASINSEAFFSSYQATGASSSSLNHPQIMTANTDMGSGWARMVEAENNALPFHSPSEINFCSGSEDLIPLSLSFNSTEVKQLSFCQPLSKSISTSGTGVGSSKTFVDGLDEDIDPGCAHSHLSPAPAETHTINPSHNMQQPAYPAQSPHPGPHYSGIGMEGGAVETLFGFHASSSQNLHFQETSRISSNSSGEPHQTISFSWDL